MVNFPKIDVSGIVVRVIPTWKPALYLQPCWIQQNLNDSHPT